MWAQRVFIAVMLVVAVGLVGLGAWGATVSLATHPGSGAAAASASPPPAPASVALQPADRAVEVAPNRPVTITVSNGRIDAATLTGADGGTVPGTISPDGHTWTAPTGLAYAATYRYGGTVTGLDGVRSPIQGSFATVAPADTTSASINIPDGDTVGIAAPIEVQFDHHVADQAAVERAMTVRTSVPTTGSWAWLPDTEQGSRAHWRPQSYWRPGARVTMSADLRGVNFGDGSWGADNVSTEFTIGRSQIVKADVNSHQMVVERDGRPVTTVPASYGLGSDPNRNTTNGVHVVMSKSETVLMSNPAYGYQNVPEHWAVRISNSGEFIHANPGTTGEQGSENVTHGCVNLSTADARAYFGTALFGDPVEVTGSPVPMTRTDIYDWALTWDEWRAMSAVPT